MPSRSARRTAPNGLRRQHLAEQAYALGPKRMLHLLEEIAAGADLDEQLERYAALPADFVREMGGDRFAPNVMSVRGDRAWWLLAISSSASISVRKARSRSST